MIIGALGSIPFETSSDHTLLMSGLRWDSGARYAEHQRHNETDMLEYVGKDPDEINFDIKLSAFLGINPSVMMDRLRTLQKSRKAVKFALGTMPIPGVWVLTRLECGMEHFHKDGTLLSLDVNLTLREYVEQVNLPVITTRISFTNRMVSGPEYKPPIPPPSPFPPVGSQITGTGTITSESAPLLESPHTGARVIDNYKRGTVTGLVEDVGAYYGVLHARGPKGVGYILKTHFSIQSQPSTAAANRKPVVPATTKPVTMSATPVTKPTTVANVATAIKKVPAVLAAVGNKIVSNLSNLGVVQIIKNAFAAPSYPAAKAAPAKPIVKSPPKLNTNKTNQLY